MNDRTTNAQSVTRGGRIPGTTYLVTELRSGDMADIISRTLVNNVPAKAPSRFASADSQQLHLAVDHITDF
jgi:hypothetical protein